MANSNTQLKTHRVLSLFKRLASGEIIQKSVEAERFHVTEKSIQRDLDDIREYLAEEQIEGKCCEVIWSPTHKGYTLVNISKTWLEKHDVLAIAKVLLESRAFCMSEMDSLLDKLLLQVSPEERQHIQKIISNEKFHYAPVKHGKELIHNLWILSEAVREQRQVRLNYKKENDDQYIQRIVEPQGIIFSEYYFYLIACIHGAKYEFPAIYRIDRIQDMVILSEHFSISYCNRFEEGEFRKRVQFMHSGPLLRIKFKYWGKSLDAVMDRLPTARVVESDGKVTLLEAEVFGKGIKMWLLSQAECLEVLGPAEFREEMKWSVGKMLSQYTR
ncbi:hypothetical protein SOV_52350 [Sporomusa ovata DSM 2662]|uniref:WYL domain-containing protein n=2 Tax=Sporomusa ovata TaxID=2378 RepID=A0A0U1KRC9_9FIRM|nr:WYL domain-containing protein [Sporomusa ovata]EQB27607.1 hypothetical protein SOV_2c05040 [Sporomusa ovata DSM 2662]CQR69960.1 FIG00673019: hypothetical protein [Sporomusa ovata]